jgi:hypothetical protein
MLPGQGHRDCGGRGWKEAFALFPSPGWTLDSGERCSFLRSVSARAIMLFALIPITTIRSAMSKLIKDSSYGECEDSLGDVLPRLSQLAAPTS